jgi:hypothetical protein
MWLFLFEILLPEVPMARQPVTPVPVLPVMAMAALAVRLQLRPATVPAHFLLPGNKDAEGVRHQISFSKLTNADF